MQRQSDRRDRRGKDAVSEYRVLKSFAAASLIEIRLGTGKQHQIRVQAGLRGHPLVGERRYAASPQALFPISFARQALHAHRLVLRHPVTNESKQFESPLPADLTALIAGLETRA